MDEEVAAVGRGREVGHESGRAEGRSRARDGVDDEELGPRVVLEEVRVARRADEVLERGHLRRLARGLLDERTDRHARRRRSGATLGGDRPNQEAPVAPPPRRPPEDVVEAHAGDGGRVAGRRLADPQLDAVGEVSAEGEEPAVGRERGRAEPRAVGQGHADRRAAGHGLDGERGEAVGALPAPGGGHDAHAAHAQDRLGEEGDRRIGLGLGEQDDVAPRAHVRLGRRRRVDEVDDLLRRELVGRLAGGGHGREHQEQREQAGLGHGSSHGGRRHLERLATEGGLRGAHSAAFARGPRGRGTAAPRAGSNRRRIGPPPLAQGGTP